MRPIILTLLFAITLLLPYANPPRHAAAQTDERCFTETGFCIRDRIREFWEQNGGLPVFGLPIAPQQEALVEGRPIQVQWFERNRLELHPENQRPYDVLLGRLGVDRLAQQGRDWFSFAKGGPRDGCLFFDASGHTICEPFLSVWRSNGLELNGAAGKTQDESLALFGLPISEPQTETLSDGRQYTVQWFERARFEAHPENQPPFNVLLGLLGNELGAAPGAVPPPAPTPPPAPPPSFNNCQDDSNTAPNAPIRIITVDKRGENVTIQNVSGSTVSLDGWRICSIRGNQLHATLSGQIGAGQTQTIERQADTDIWSNSETDNAALYDAEGRLISYWADLR